MTNGNERESNKKSDALIIRIHPVLKRKFKHWCAGQGLTMTEAILDFMRSSLRNGNEIRQSKTRKKPPAAKDECGSRMGTGAAKINHFVLYEMTAPMRAAEIAEALGEKHVRVNRHIDWLQKYAQGAPRIVKYAGAKWGRPGLNE